MSPNSAAPVQLIAVELRVASLAHSLAFYVEKLGLVAAAVKTDSAELSVGTDAPVLLRLTEDRAAPPAPSEAAGLFHAALLLESRTALAGWVRRAAERGVEFDGFADHGVSEAIYLSDPDGNGLEFYADRPAEAWPAGAQAGEVAMFTRPLNLPGLLAEQGPAALSPLAGARWGHLHLRVTNLERSENFYRGALGMIVTQRSFPGARFLAADGYHHHVGLNCWGSPRRPQPAGALGLVSATFRHGKTTGDESLQDPDGIHLRVTGA